jgi:hypothetical protein
MVLIIEAASELESDNDWITKNLKQYLAPGKKKELICRWADNLEKLHELGKFKKPVCEISTDIKVYMKAHNMHHALPYVHEVLAPKYKTLTNLGKDFKDTTENEEILVQNSSNHLLDSKTLLAQDCVKGNANYVQRLDRTIKILSLFKHDLETTVPLEIEIPERELEEYFLRWDIMLKRCKEIRDGREKVLPTTQHLLHFAAIQTTLNNVYSQYVKYVREFSILTPKQTGKILKGKVSEIDILYEPKNMREAKFAGFYGTQCQRCEGFDTASWRVEYKYNSDSNNFGLYCYKCGKWHKPKTERLAV